MISKSSSTTIRSVYSNNTSDMKQTQKSVSQKPEANISKQGDMSKIEEIKSSIESGEYKINLKALSEKIAQELL